MTSNDTEQTTRSPYSAYLGSPDTHIGATQPIALRKGLLDGISVAQIIAAAAAAVTSMLLSSKIGIAGSVIGAAVSSVVTVVCSQLYRNALDTSARKLKAKQAMRAYQAQERVLDTLDAYGTSTASSTTNMSPEAAHEDTRTPHIRIAPTKLQARAAAERSASKRKVTFASILIAVLAVVISAGASCSPPRERAWARRRHPCSMPQRPPISRRQIPRMKLPRRRLRRQPRKQRKTATTRQMAAPRPAPMPHRDRAPRRAREAQALAIRRTPIQTPVAQRARTPVTATQTGPHLIAQMEQGRSQPITAPR